MLVNVLMEPSVLNLSTTAGVVVKKDWLRKIFRLDRTAQAPVLLAAGSVFTKFIYALLVLLLLLLLHLLSIHWSELGCPIASAAI